MKDLLVLDHLIYGTRDLAAAARRFRNEHGLESYEGGRHEGMGTGNAIVPLGDAYIEIMGIVDPEQARLGPLGTWLASRTEGGDGFVAGCVRCGDLDGLAARLSLTPVPMQRRRPDGSLLSWRLAGLERAMADGSFPFFIQWDVPEHDLPGRIPLEHPSGATRLTWVSVGASESELEAWLGPHELPLRVGDGEGLRGCGVSGAQGAVALP